MPEDAYSVPVAAAIEEIQDSPVVPSQPLPAPPPTCSVTLLDGCYRLLISRTSPAAPSAGQCELIGRRDTL